MAALNQEDVKKISRDDNPLSALTQAIVERYDHVSDQWPTIELQERGLLIQELVRQRNEAERRIERAIHELNGFKKTDRVSNKALRVKTILRGFLPDPCGRCKNRKVKEIDKGYRCENCGTEQVNIY